MTPADPNHNDVSPADGTGAFSRKRTSARRSEYDDLCLDWLWRTLYSADGRHADCPRCRQRRSFHRVAQRLSYSCDSCGWHLHPAAGTLFHHSHVPLGVWFRAVALVAHQPDAARPARLAAELDVSPRTAARMIRLIRDTIENEQPHAPGGLPAAIQRELVALIAQAVSAHPDRLARASVATPLARNHVSATGARIEAFAAHTDPRERILEAACRAIVKHGMGATRIADIAREAGVSSAIVHYYFSTKDAVLLEAARWVERETVAQRDRIVYGNGRALIKLAHFIDAQRVSHELSWQEIIVYLGLWGRAIRSPRYRVESTRGRQVWKAYWVAMLEQGVGEGEFTLAAPLDDVVERVSAFLDGISIQILLGHPWLDEQRAADLTYEFVAEQVGVPASALRAAAAQPLDKATAPFRLRARPTHRRPGTHPGPGA